MMKILSSSNEMVFDDTLTFKYYDQSEDMIYNVEETFVFIPNMIEGDHINPIQMHIDYSTGVNGNPDSFNDRANGFEGQTLAGLSIGEHKQHRLGLGVVLFFLEEQG